ncbi:MAG TPA: hypothetical protein VFX96_09540 [Pyrinomonadaceae bacterium]|nr:hypothetical protein [Pyrinomonadaceae bacterium]
MEKIQVLRRPRILVPALILLACAFLSSQTPDTSAQQQGEVKQAEAKKMGKGAEPSAETIAETVVFVYGSRPVLDQVRRTGVERGRVSRTTPEGAVEEISYERSFKRGETSEKDKVRLDQRKPTVEYSLIYTEGRVLGVIRGTSFTPRQEEVSEFHSQRRHGLETLLRYKENGAKLTYSGKDKQRDIEMWMLDLEDKDKNRTRYFISTKTGRVLWLEYDAAAVEGEKPVKFKRTFHDYRVVQGTQVPYRTVLYANDRKLEESQVMTVTFGVKLDDERFQNSDTTANSGGY